MIGARPGRVHSPPARLRRRHVLVDGLRVHVRVGGRPSAGPVVPCHGLIVPGRSMVPFAERLASRYRVYVPDLPGLGSSEGRESLDAPALADALAAILDALDAGRAAFFGNSFGRQILAHLAVRHRGRVDRVVFQGPTTDPGGRTYARRFWRSPILLADYRDAGVARALATIRFMMRDRIEDVLPRVQRCARLLPRGRLQVLPGSAAANFAAPLELARTLRWFFDGAGEA